MAGAKKAATKKRVAKKKSTHAAKDTAANAIDDQLERYRSMRDFHVTAEPDRKSVV